MTKMGSWAGTMLLAVLLGCATTSTTTTTDTAAGAKKPLYDRLGGVFAIAAVVEHFSDAVVKNPIVGQASKNPALREWHTKQLGRLPGLNARSASTRRPGARSRCE